MACAKARCFPETVADCALAIFACVRPFPATKWRQDGAARTSTECWLARRGSLDDSELRPLDLLDFERLRAE